MKGGAQLARRGKDREKVVQNTTMGASVLELEDAAPCRGAQHAGKGRQRFLSGSKTSCSTLQVQNSALERVVSNHTE